VSFANPPTATGAGGVSTNTAFGTNSLSSNTSGSNNTAIGYGAAYSNVTGSPVTAVGYYALYNNTGNFNTAVGGGAGAAGATWFAALQSNTSGTYNTALGTASIGTNSSGSYNTGIGFAALANNTTASNNTAVGYQAGYSQTTGAGNVYVGQTAGYTNSGGANTFIGTASGYAMAGGNYNTIIGSFSGNQGGLNITTSSNYIVLSDGAGNVRAFSNGSGSWGFNTASPDSGAIITVQANSGGNGMSVKAGTNGNYGIYFNNVANSTVGGIIINSASVAYNTTSDPRLKNITGAVTSEAAIAFVQALQPKTGTWIADGSPFTGFVTTDYEKVDASAVVGQANAVDAEGKPVYQQMEYGSSAWCANMTAALQYALTTITDLQAKLKAANVAGF
jgi:hypothetical protein